MHFMVSEKIQEFKEEWELLDFLICSGSRTWTNAYLFMKINALYVQYR